MEGLRFGIQQDPEDVLWVSCQHLGELNVGAVSLLAKLQGVHIVALEGCPVAEAPRIGPVEQSPELLVGILRQSISLSQQCPSSALDSRARLEGEH